MLRDAHAHWASLQSNGQLAAWTAARNLDLLGVQQTVAGAATLYLSLLIGRTITVTILETTVSGAGHVAIKDVLGALAELLTADLREDAFETD